MESRGKEKKRRKSVVFFFNHSFISMHPLTCRFSLQQKKLHDQTAVIKWQVIHEDNMALMPARKEVFGNGQAAVAGHKEDTSILGDNYLFK